MAINTEKNTVSFEKPRLTFSQIWNMNFGFLGIQFGFALQNANVSRIFETLGANIDEIAILWIAAPTTGLIVQPIIGHFSDRTWHPKWGRRRPYFTLGAILASLALLIMPHSSALWMAAGMLWILDASINISMEPFRAFVGDMLPDKQRTVGFATQTFFIGLGAVIASALPYIFSNWIGLESTAPKGQIPPSVIWSFYIGALVFFGAVMWTVFNTREYSPQEMAEFNGPQTHQEEEGFAQIFKDFINMPATMRQLALVQFFSWLALFAMWIYSTPGISSHNFDMKIDKNLYYDLDKMLRSLDKNSMKEKEQHEYKKMLEQLDLTKKKFDRGDQPSLPLSVVDFALNEKIILNKDLISAFDKANLLTNEKKLQDELKKSKEQLKDTTEKINLSYELISFFNTPENINKLSFDDKQKSQLNLISELKSVKKEYNAGGDWVGIMFAVYNGFSAFFAFFFPPFARATSRKTAHIVGLLTGSIGLISIFFMPNKEMLLLSMVGVGFAWASILSMPYAILAGALPPNKMGIYMGIFNFFIVIPQIIAAAVLGFILRYVFENEAIYAMIVGGVSMLIAAALVVFVKDEGDKKLL
jgi:maltose/moltooligosaccharide transporter